MTDPIALRYLRRNFLMFLADYVLFATAYRLTEPNSVIPDFIQRLTGDQRVIGLVGIIPTLFWLAPQLLFAQFISRRSSRQPYLRPIFLVRIVVLIMAGVIAAGGTNGQSEILVGFIVCYMILWVTDGFFTIVWADLLGSSLPDKSRSTLYLLGTLGTALGAFAARFIVEFLLSDRGPIFPYNYAWLFGIAGVLLVVGGVALALMKEETTTVVIPRGPTLRELIPYIGEVLRTDAKFRHFTIMRTLADLATLVIPFYVIVGTDELRKIMVEPAFNEARATFIGNTVLLATFGSLISSFVTGWLSRQYGSRAVLRAAAVSKIGMPLFGLMALYFGVAWPILGVFFCIGFSNSAFGPGFFDWVISHAPSDRRPIYIGLTNTISAVGNIAPLIGGFVLSATGSYGLLLVIALGFSIGHAYFTLGLSEPRVDRLPTT